MKNRAVKVGTGLLVCQVGLELSGAGQAWAGAWVPNKDGGYSSSGIQRDLGEYGDAWRAESYFEGGFGGGWGWAGKAETLWRDGDGGDDRLAGQIALRRQLFKSAGFVASGQFGVLIGESLEAPLCEGRGLDSRVLAGWSGPMGGAKLWVSTEAGFRNQGGCDRWKVDLAAGLEVDERWQVTANAFHQTGDGPDSLKLEAGVARKIDKDFVGVAYRREVGGVFEEESWILKFSRQF